MFEANRSNGIARWISSQCLRYETNGITIQFVLRMFEMNFPASIRAGEVGGNILPTRTEHDSGPTCSARFGASESRTVRHTSNPLPQRQGKTGYIGS